VKEIQIVVVMLSREVLNLASGSVHGFSSVGGLLGIIALCVFAAQTAQEYTYGTLRNLLVRQPGRIRVLVGKLIAMKLFRTHHGGILQLSVSISISYYLSDRAKVSTALVVYKRPATMQLLRHLLNVSISVIYFGIVGMILGLLLTFTNFSNFYRSALDSHYREFARRR
jgi:hypothetical protein